jgi:thermitase
VKSETQRVSVHTSFRQTVSALSQSRRSSSSSAYFDALTDVRAHADTSVSAGGGLAGFFGAPQVKGETGFDTQTTVASGASTRTASEQFSQLAVTASQAMEAERSLVVSRFEDEEHQTTTARALKNDNRCHAVTYYVRRVNEVYEISTRVESIEWRLGDGPWRQVSDLDGVPDGLRKLLEELRRHLPRVGDLAKDPRRVTMPTDGTLYEAELAHCSSCEPVREAEELAHLELLRLSARQKCLEVDLLALELERRRALLGAQQGTPLALQPWPFGAAAVPVMPDHD